MKRSSAEVLHIRNHVPQKGFPECTEGALPHRPRLCGDEPTRKGDRIRSGKEPNDPLLAPPLHLSYEDLDEVRRAFDALAAGGEVQMPLEPVFWSPLFGACVDRFGVSWGTVALIDRRARSTDFVAVGLARSLWRVHQKLPPRVGVRVWLRCRVRSDRVAGSG